MFDIEKIQKILPQRFPFLLIDRVIEFLPQKKVTATKNVSINEAFFEGHFPDQPVVPGVLIIEAMAQAAIILFYRENAPERKSPRYYLGSVKAKFLSPVFPGDQLLIEVEPVKIISGAAIVSAVASVAAKEVAKAELSFSVKDG